MNSIQFSFETLFPLLIILLMFAVGAYSFFFTDKILKKPRGLSGPILINLAFGRDFAKFGGLIMMILAIVILAKTLGY